MRDEESWKIETHEKKVKYFLGQYINSVVLRFEQKKNMKKEENISNSKRANYHGKKIGSSLSWQFKLSPSRDRSNYDMGKVLYRQTIPQNPPKRGSSSKEKEYLMKRKKSQEKNFGIKGHTSNRLKSQSQFCFSYLFSISQRKYG